MRPPVPPRERDPNDGGMPPIADAVVLRVQPGDAIAVTVAVPISLEAAERFKVAWRKVVSGTALEHVPVILLDGGTQVSIMRSDAA